MKNMVTFSGCEETVVRHAVAPAPEDLRCVGCQCREPCHIARIASELSYREAVALYRLGDVPRLFRSSRASQTTPGRYCDRDEKRDNASSTTNP